LAVIGMGTLARLNWLTISTGVGLLVVGLAMLKDVFRAAPDPDRARGSVR
jgi:hypothetical protein